MTAIAFRKNETAYYRCPVCGYCSTDREDVADCQKSHIRYGEISRLGKSGGYAKKGDMVMVVKGRKYPIGMRMVVDGFDAYCKYTSYDGRFSAYGQKQIVFGGEGKMESISADNVIIIATDRQDPAYNNVHSIEL